MKQLQLAQIDFDAILQQVYRTHFLCVPRHDKTNDSRQTSVCTIDPQQSMSASKNT